MAGRPMLEWSVAALRAVDEIDEIVVALPPGTTAPEGTTGVPGGEHRSQSVRAALAAGAGDPVVVHDAARPLVTAQLVRAALDELAAHACDGVIAAAPVTDTIKEARDGLVSRTLERSGLWAVQTPQVFRREALERALSASDEVLAAATDDAWLVERAGGSVRVVAAPHENLKVTTPGDLQLAELTLGRVSPTDVARRYVELSNAVDYEAIADLFAADAEWIPISPMQPRRGREAIREGYLRQVQPSNRPIVNDRYYAEGLTCVVEFEVDLGSDGIASIVDILTLNEKGEIARLAVYRR